MDCGVACLASLLNVEYDDVYAVALEFAPKLAKDGMYQHAVVDTAAKFGAVLVRKRKYDLDDVQLGIVMVEFANGDLHYVTAHNGQVWEPAAGKMYAADDFAKLVKRFRSALVVS